MPRVSAKSWAVMPGLELRERRNCFSVSPNFTPNFTPNSLPNVMPNCLSSGVSLDYSLVVLFLDVTSRFEYLSEHKVDEGA